MRKSGRVLPKDADKEVHDMADSSTLSSLSLTSEPFLD